MANRGLFMGHALQGIDAKGRVGIPSTLRATIERNGGGQTVVIGINAVSGCLTGADSDQPHIAYDRIDREQERALDHDRAPRLAVTSQELFGMVEPAPFDASGRFILPPFHREEAGLTNWAFFLANGDHFQIWDPQRLLDSDAPDIVKRALRSCAAQKGATL